MDSVLAFTGIAALMAISPGPDMAVMLRNVLRAGTPVVLPTALGIVSGLAGWAVASAVGISALVAASAEAYATFRLMGAAYLAVVGLIALRHALAPAHDARRTARYNTRENARDDRPEDARDDTTSPPAAAAAIDARAAYRLGLLTNLSNPKVGIFYATLLPQFIPAGAPVLGTSLLLAGIHAALGLAWLTAYGRALDRLAGTLSRGPGRRVLEGITGTVLLGLGARVATES